MQVERSAFYKPEEILNQVEQRIKKVRNVGESIDYLTFVSDGEPTLDINLGVEIELLRQFEIKIAVITNASLIWLQDVRQELAKANWVSLKIDSTCEEIWRKINRPHTGLRLSSILDSILEFAEVYNGELVTETMLVKNLNDDVEHVKEVVDFLARLKPAKAYLAIPTRPPSEGLVEPPDENAINRAYQIFTERISGVEYLIGYEGNSFAFTGNVEQDLLDITAVHPMREEAVKQLLLKAKVDCSVIDRLIAEEKLVKTEYMQKKFIMRKFSGRS